MHIICLTPVEEGVYNDHKAEHITIPPDGWAYIPDDMPLPSTFPRLGDIEAEEMIYTKKVYDKNENKVDTTYAMMTVTRMTEGALPEVAEEEHDPTADELINVLLGVGK